jgi:transcriptional regulator with XRE-family HTH domain
MLDPERQQQERKDLAETLRELRKAAGLSGERLAARCSMSQSKISRIERGNILPSVSEVQRILTALRIPDGVARGVVDLARTANVHYKSFRAYAQVGLWWAQDELKALAKSSTVVRQFLPAVPSSLLQSEEYARRILTPSVAGDVSRDIERTVAARLDAQQVLRDESRQFFFVMPEHAVRWRHADSRIMAGQCIYMAELAEQLTNVEVAVIPQTTKVLDVPLHTFVIYDERLVEIELFAGEVALRDPKDISFHLDIFKFFWEHALTGTDSTTFLRFIAGDFMRELD